MITPSAERIKNEVRGRWPNVAFQVYNVRYIAGTRTWSQHSWGNALDIFGTVAEMDEIALFLESRKSAGLLPIGTILWRVRDHYDHIHVEGTPKMTGTPPGATEEDDMTELIEMIQQSIVDVGFDIGSTGPAGNGVDGVLGPKTKAGWLALVQQATDPHSHNVTVTLEPPA
jgi:hypothetical protein